MGNASSSDVKQTFLKVFSAIVPLALKALETAAVVAEKPLTGDDQLQQLIDNAQKMVQKDFADHFGYLWNGQSSKPHNYTSGPMLAANDFLFYDLNNAKMNDMQMYITGLLQSMQHEYNMGAIAINVTNACEQIYSGPTGAWVKTSKTYTAFNDTTKKNVEVDIMFLTYNSPRPDKVTLIAMAAVWYDAQVLMKSKLSN